MPSPLQTFRGALPLIVCIGFLAGCATMPSPQPSQPSQRVVSGSPPTVTASAENEYVPVARYGRYTLIELVPEFSQRDLLQQVIEISIPPTLDASVGDAMHHMLLRSGYRLCDNATAKALYNLPLPAAHLHLGPLILRDALLTLAGPAWDLSTDDAARQVCFTRHSSAPPLPDSTNTAEVISPNTAERPFTPSEEARP
ncbi:PilL N-terminal domain-containing protein [Pseudomonas silesiensis]